MQEREPGVGRFGQVCSAVAGELHNRCTHVFSKAGREIERFLQKEIKVIDLIPAGIHPPSVSLKSTEGTEMNVTFYAFSLKFPAEPVITAGDWFESFSQGDGHSRGDRVIVGTPIDKDFFVGVAVRDRANRTQNLKRIIEKKKVISPHRFGDGEFIVDMSFFAIYRPTMRGLYQEHYHSISMGQFLADASHIYWHCVTDFITKNDLKVEGLRKAKHLQTDEISSKDGVDGMLKSLEQINRARVRLIEFQPPDENMVAISPYVKSYTHEIVFDAKRSAPLKQRLASWFKSKENLQSATVYGVDEHGVEQPVTLDLRPEKLGRQPYDEWFHGTKLDSSDWATSLKGCGPVKSLVGFIKSKGRINALITSPEK